MAFIALKCPSCGAEINLDKSREFGFCSYCGTKIIQDKQVVEKRIVYDNSQKIENNVILGNKYFNNKDWAKAYKCFETVLKYDAKNADANKKMDILNNRKATPNIRFTLSAGLFAKIQVYIDNILLGQLSSGHELTTTLRKGKHTLKLVKSGMMTSMPFTIKDEFEKTHYHFTLTSSKKLDFHAETY